MDYLTTQALPQDAFEEMWRRHPQPGFGRDHERRMAFAQAWFEKRERDRTTATLPRS